MLFTRITHHNKNVLQRMDTLYKIYILDKFKQINLKINYDYKTNKNIIKCEIISYKTIIISNFNVGTCY